MEAQKSCRRVLNLLLAHRIKIVQVRVHALDNVLLIMYAYIIRTYTTYINPCTSTVHTYPVHVHDVLDVY